MDAEIVMETLDMFPEIYRKYEQCSKGAELALGGIGGYGQLSDDEQNVLQAIELAKMAKYAKIITSACELISIITDPRIQLIIALRTLEDLPWYQIQLAFGGDPKQECMEYFKKIEEMQDGNENYIN